MPSISHILNEINYEMVRQLAEGGMGVVYEAHQLGAGQFRKTVAVKLIREEYSAIPEFQKNFIGEARLVADLIHTNIVQTYHLGSIGGQYFMVMEYVGGQNIEQFLEKHRQTGKQVPVDLAAFIVSRVARGLTYAHQKRDRSGNHLNIVHRDIGPKNVLMGYEGDVKLTDFGIAKALNLMYNEEGKVIAGKDEYLSPEQASYAVTDARADLFPLGIVLTEILLGRNIFRNVDRSQSRRNILTMPIPRFATLRPDIDERLETIIQKALRRDRDQRYQSAAEMLHDLEVYLYSDGYGPTNEKLGTYMRDLFAVRDPQPPAPVSTLAPPARPMSSGGFSQDLRQRQSQSLVLAPQLRQSLKILQVAALDLRSVIQEELQSNPTLEELPMDGMSAEKPEAESTESDANGDDAGASAEGTPDPAAEPKSDEMDFSKEFEILGKIDDDWRDYMASAGGSQSYSAEDAERRQHFFDSVATETSLQEHLMRQAEMTDLDPKSMEAMQHLVGSLDDRGFLTVKTADVALQTGLPLDAVQEAVAALKAFDPAGIGAESLAECLLAQLAAKGRRESLASRIIRDHFELLTRRRIPELSRKLGAASDDVQGAIEEIGKLDPAPGRRFADDQNRVVVPDVIVEHDGNDWKIHLNNDYIPRLRISSTYRDLIAKGSLSKGERDYLKDRMRSGKFLIDSIEQRQRTIERITREILKAQMPFFEHGVAQLRPLTMTQIADVVGVHETTVSRAIANKYIRTPHGVFEFKYFFTPGYQNDSGASVSNTSVKEMIADLVAGEDKAGPFSDQELVTRLQEKGINIARRTVAKYREELGILPSNLRRDYK